MLTRAEFAEHWNEVAPGKLMGMPDSPLWIPEDDGNARCEWFIHILPIIRWVGSRDKLDFWLWCETNLTGVIRCFSSDDISQEEWWGFSHQADIVHWLLRWA